MVRCSRVATYPQLAGGIDADAAPRGGGDVGAELLDRGQRAAKQTAVLRPLANRHAMAPSHPDHALEHGKTRHHDRLGEGKILGEVSEQSRQLHAGAGKVNWEW